MVYEAKNEAENNLSDVREITDQEMTLFIAPMCSEPKYITAAREIVLNPKCETPLLFFT